MPQTTAPPSFIPHEAATHAAPVRRPQRGLADLFALIGLVLCVASIALGVGVFLYREYLSASSSSKIDQLQRAKAAFEPSLIAELTRLDDRMRSAGEILQKHIAPSSVLTMLEQTTIASVGFSGLDFEMTDSETIGVHMDGIAGSVNGIALQADLFSKGGMLASPIFSNINRELDGVHFSLSASVNPLSINFAQLLITPASPDTQQQMMQIGGPASNGPEGVFGTEEENI